MPLQQNIDSARAEKIGAHGVTKAALDDALARSEAALDWLREAHDRRDSCRCCGCRRRPTISTRSRRPPRGCAPARPTSCSSAPAARASAGRRWRSLPASACAALEALRAGPRMHFMDNLDPVTFARPAREAAARDHALRRDLEIRRHRRDADADRRRARGREGGGARGAHRRAVLRPQRARRSPASTTACAICSGPSVPLLEHDPGVGGRFSVLTNVGLLPAAILGLDIAAIRAGAAHGARAGAREEARRRRAGRARRRAQRRAGASAARPSPC